MTAIEELLEAVLSVGSAPGLYNEDPHAGSVELRESKGGIFAGLEGSERGKLKNLHC
jgi:hypothetical protein